MKSNNSIRTTFSTANAINYYIHEKMLNSTEIVRSDPRRDSKPIVKIAVSDTQKQRETAKKPRDQKPEVERPREDKFQPAASGQKQKADVVAAPVFNENDKHEQEEKVEDAAKSQIKTAADKKVMVDQKAQTPPRKPVKEPEKKVDDVPSVLKQESKPEPEKAAEQVAEVKDTKVDDIFQTDPVIEKPDDNGLSLAEPIENLFDDEPAVVEEKGADGNVFSDDVEAIMNKYLPKEEDKAPVVETVPSVEATEIEMPVIDFSGADEEPNKETSPSLSQFFNEGTFGPQANETVAPVVKQEQKGTPIENVFADDLQPVKLSDELLAKTAEKPQEEELPVLNLFQNAAPAKEPAVKETAKVEEKEQPESAPIVFDIKEDEVLKFDEPSFTEPVFEAPVLDDSMNEDEAPRLTVPSPKKEDKSTEVQDVAEPKAAVSPVIEEPVMKNVEPLHKTDAAIDSNEYTSINDFLNSL